MRAIAVILVVLGLLLGGVPAHAASPARKAQIIRQVFGPYGRDAVRVARCESGPSIDVNARNGQYRGAFQMGRRERKVYGHGRTILAQARAAHRYFRAAGGWSPWECKP